QIFVLYREQQGRCALCKMPITQETGWQEHNRVPRHRGGRDVIGNRVLLHPSCHHEYMSANLRSTCWPAEQVYKGLSRMR
ncbi:HNH endonuclease, partial [Xenorhabdus entomophaga]|uniref:HNH endonuclease n=1 Tax=Xenorhabdus entomophaga TaxID=3136257 RepID=UPI0030F3BED2